MDRNLAKSKARFLFVVREYVAVCSAVRTSKGGCRSSVEEIYSFTRTNVSSSNFSLRWLVPSSMSKCFGKSERGAHHECVVSFSQPHFLLFFFYNLLPLRLQNKKKWFAVLSSNNPPSLIGDKFEAGKLRTTSNKENKNAMTQCRKASNVTGEFV